MTASLCTQGLLWWTPQLHRWLKALKTCSLPCLGIHSNLTASHFCQACPWCSCKRLSSSPMCIPNALQAGPHQEKCVFFCSSLLYSPGASPPQALPDSFSCSAACPQACEQARASPATKPREQQIWNCNVDNTESFSVAVGQMW